MSRIGRKPIVIPKGVQVSITKDSVSAKGPKGSLSMKRHSAIEIKQAKDEDGKDVVVFERKGNDGPTRAAHGLMRALVGNMLTGVTDGFTRQLEINGVGYKAALAGKNLQLSLGYSHDVIFPIPAGVTIATPKPTEITIAGIDKQQVGQVAAEIREFRGPEPYKGKGVRYDNEQILRKEGKKK
jgi:large subunit ribosomal protein L6